MLRCPQATKRPLALCELFIGDVAKYMGFYDLCSVRPEDSKLYTNYCPPCVAMFGVQRGEGAVQLASARSETQGGSLTHPHCGTRFSLCRVCLYLHAKLVPNAAQKLLTFVWHFAAFFTHVRT